MEYKCKSCIYLLEEVQPIHPLGNAINYLCNLVTIQLKNMGKKGLNYIEQFKKENNGMDCNFIGKNIADNYCPDWCPLYKFFI